MTSVVIDLQKDALNNTVSVTDLLRKALVVARKLKLSEFQSWIETELNGYDKDIPDYRLAHGEVKAWNDYRGWQTVHFKDPKEAEILSTRPIGQAIAELEDLFGRGSDDASFYLPFSPSLQKQLSNALGRETQIALFCQRSPLVRVIDAVRNIILNWALKLEEEGILGEGLSFSDKEKSVAANSPQSVNNFYGPVQNAQIAQGSSEVIQVAGTVEFNKEALVQLLRKLQAALPDLALDASVKAELQAEIATVDAQTVSPKPKSGIIRESLTSIRAILEGAGGGAAGELIIELGKLLLS